VLLLSVNVTAQAVVIGHRTELSVLSPHELISDLLAHFSYAHTYLSLFLSLSLFIIQPTIFPLFSIYALSFLLFLLVLLYPFQLQP
jgi:hypothetical protein